MIVFYIEALTKDLDFLVSALDSEVTNGDEREDKCGAVLSVMEDEAYKACASLVIFAWFVSPGRGHGL